MPDGDSAEAPTPRARSRRLGGFVRRHPYWMALLLLVVATRIALPYILRPVLESQLSALLNGHIAVENVDLALLRGEVAVDGVGVFVADDSSAVVSFQKLLANIRWTGLFSKQAIVEDVQLLSPHIRVVREIGGGINLARLPAPAAADVPPPEEPAPAAEASAAPGWPFGLTRLAIEDASIVFSDNTVEGFKDLDFHIDSLGIDRVAYGGPIYDHDGKITLSAEIGGAPLKIEADFASQVDLATSKGNIVLHDLDVGLGSAYTARLLGWSDLGGKLDIDLDFGVESGRSRAPRVLVALRDFLIAVKGEEEPALKWDSLEIELARVDPEDRFVDVAAVRLNNPVVRVRPADPQPLVLLGKMKEQKAAGEPAAEAAAAGPPADAAGGDEKPFGWQLGKLVVDGAHVLVETAEKNFDVAVHVELAGLTSEPASQGELKVATSVEGATLDVGGTLAIAPPSFAGKVTLADLSLPALLPLVPDPRAAIVHAGVARSDLAVSFAMRAGEGGEQSVDAGVSGSLGLAGLEVAGDDAERFSVRWDDLAIDVAGVEVRGGVPAAEGGKAPIRIASVVLDKPALYFMRLEDGSIALPEELAAGDAKKEEEPSVDAADVQHAKEVTAEVREEAGSPAIEVDKVRVSKGSVRVVDRSVQPEVKPGLKSFSLALDGVRMPERRIDDLKFSAAGVRGGKIQATGKVAGDATDIVLKIDKYRLVPYDPYATSLAGYGIRRGLLTVESTVHLRGDDFDTHTNVIVHKLGLKNVSGGTAFEDNVGVPVNLALALLKDAQGDITLDVPVKGSRGETEVALGAVIMQQLRRILVNALASPLKLFGVGSGDDVGDISAVRIGFAAGGGALSPEGRAAAEKLAGLLRERPELAVSLDAKSSDQDVRPLQEAALLAEWRGRDNLPDDYAAMRDYLEAKLAGEKADLPEYLQPMLEDLLSHQRPPRAQVEQMARGRVELVRALMVDQLQVRPPQVTVEEHLGRGVVEGPAVVEAEIGVVDDEDSAADDVGDLAG